MSLVLCRHWRAHLPMVVALTCVAGFSLPVTAHEHDAAKPAPAAQPTPETVTSASGQYDLGLAYLQGTGRPADLGKAKEWFGKSAAQGFPPALYAFGVILAQEKKPAEGFALFMRSAQAGFAPAQFDVATALASGSVPGVAKDPTAAFQWMSKAAAADHARAQYMLGQMYMDGTGTPRDGAKALEWFLKAAQKGVLAAQYSAGHIYYAGLGTPKRPDEAFRWFSMAAEQWHMQSQVNLGVMYFNGDGVPQSDSMAFFWWDIAASLGQEESHQYRAKVAMRMNEQQIAAAHAKAVEWMRLNHAKPHEHSATTHLHGTAPAAR